MRIESPVGCPTSAGDPAEEKAVPDGSTGLFTSILDCFRLLVSGPPSDEASSGKTFAAAGKPVDQNALVPNGVASFPATREATAARLNDAVAHAPAPSLESREGSETRVKPTLVVASAVPFTLTIPGLVADGQQVPAAGDAGSNQVHGRGHEVLAAVKTGTPAGFPDLPATPGNETDPHTDAALDAVLSGSLESADGSKTTVTEGIPLDAGYNSAGIEQNQEAAALGLSTSVADLSTPPLLVQATTAALATGPGLLQPEDPSSGDRKASVMSSIAAQPAKGMFLSSGMEQVADVPTASATAWMSWRNISSTRANMTQPGGRSVKAVTQSQATAASEERVAYTKLIGLAGGTSPAVEAGVEAHGTASHFPAQRPAEERPAPTPIEPADRQEPGPRADSRPTAADPGAEARLQPQPESPTRPAGILKTAAAVDPATLAVEQEKVTAGRGRLGTTLEGGAREASAGSSLSALARETQISAQASTGVKDVKAPAFVFEVAERISTVVGGGRGEITIHLRPDEFGRMNIVAESGASGILARITTESASLKQYLESKLPVLQQALQDQGLKVERIDVLVQEGLPQQQSTNQWQHNFGHAPGGQDSNRTPRFAQVASAQAGEPENEITLDAVILGALHPNSTFHTVA